MGFLISSWHLESHSRITPPPLLRQSPASHQLPPSSESRRLQSVSAICERDCRCFRQSVRKRMAWISLRNTIEQPVKMPDDTPTQLVGFLSGLFGGRWYPLTDSCHSIRENLQEFPNTEPKKNTVKRIYRVVGILGVGVRSGLSQKIVVFPHLLSLQIRTKNFECRPLLVHKIS